MSNICEVQILFEGYCKPAEGGMSANCTSTLLRTQEFTIIVDTLTPWDGTALVNRLDEFNVTPDEVTHCICTHGHSDHVGCNYLFKNALQIVGKNCISRKDQYYNYDFKDPYILNSAVKIVATPGHTSEDITVLLNGEQGLVAITGDLFENEEDLSDDSIWRSCSEFPIKQMASRQMILEIADYIIPGHGPMFKNKFKSIVQ